MSTKAKLIPWTKAERDAWRWTEADSDFMDARSAILRAKRHPENHGQLLALAVWLIGDLATLTIHNT